MEMTFPVPCTSEEPDDQPHILACAKILENLSTSDLVKNKVKYDDIFGGPPEQKQITVLFRKLLEIRQEGFLRCQTSTSTVRRKVEGCRVKNGGCRIKSEE